MSYPQVALCVESRALGVSKAVPWVCRKPCLVCRKPCHYVSEAVPVCVESRASC